MLVFNSAAMTLRTLKLPVVVLTFSVSLSVLIRLMNQRDLGIKYGGEQ